MATLALCPHNIAVNQPSICAHNCHHLIYEIKLVAGVEQIDQKADAGSASVPNHCHRGRHRRISYPRREPKLEHRGTGVEHWPHAAKSHGRGDAVRIEFQSLFRSFQEYVCKSHVQKLKRGFTNKRPGMCRSAKPSNIVVRDCSALVNVGVYVSGETCNHSALLAMLDVFFKKWGVEAVTKKTSQATQSRRSWDERYP